MADLQVCYFCGSGPDGSLGEYAVVPPTLDPTDDQQHSVVLCPDCREKLTALMEPVVEAAEATAGAGGTVDADASDDGGTPPGPAGDDAVGDPGEPPDGGSTATDDRPAAGVPPDESTTGADDDVTVAPGEGDGDDGGVSIDPGRDDASAPGQPSPSGDDPLGAGDGGTDPAGAGTARAGGDDGEGPPPDSNAPRDQPHADDELVGRNNEAYNKTLRLLQNREFPVERHEIEKVAANAYQLDPQEVSDAIDALIAKGLLTQEGAQLRRP